MAFEKFPTQKALDLARNHCSRGQRWTHEQIAQDILDEMVHPDDWRAAAIRIQGLDENAEDGETLDFLSHIDEVIDEHCALKPAKPKRR